MSNLSNAVRAKVSEECLTTKVPKRRVQSKSSKSNGRSPDRQRPYVVIDMDHSECPSSIESW